MTTGADFMGWRPYIPAGYPDRGEYHNPWATDPETIQSGGKTFYRVWLDSLTPDELERYRQKTRVA